MSDADVTAEVRALWDEIAAWYAENAPDLKEQLLPGAGDERLARLEEHLGTPLPADYRASLAYHDGLVSVHSYTYLDAAQVEMWWDALQQQSAAGTFADAELAIAESEAVRKQWWHPGWIPFAADSGGNLLLLDTAPGPAGTPGQVVRWETSEGPIPTGTPSFLDWLRAYRDGLKGGEYRVDEDGLLVRR